MHDEFYSLTGKLKNILKSLYEIFFVGGRVRLHVGYLDEGYGSHYLVVEICHRWTMLSASRSLP